MTQRERWDEIRRLFPHCANCGLALASTPDGELYEVNARNRLAHRDCLAAEASDDAA